MADSFVHLHVHSEYSMLDGAARVKPLIDAAVEQGMPAVAVTDHGNMFGAFDFWRTAIDAGIKPIIGTEAYLTPGTHRTDKTRIRWGDGGGDDVSGSGAYTHMTLLAATTEGMHNLFRMSSLASIEGYYFKPRMDRELLSQYAKGIIATTGCPSGEVQTRLRLGQYEEAKKAAAEFRDIFGKENFYAEIMDHGLGIERRIMSDLIRLAKELGLPLVATNDLHYTHAADAKSHAALLCVQSGSTLDDPNRFKFDADEFYLKTSEQMRQLFRDHPDACDNTLTIAERVDVRFDTAANYMPRFPVPAGETEQTWFVKEVERGLAERYSNGVTPEVRKQADYEIGVISQMGFPGYFLVVADFINWSKDNGIRVGPGRGSGAGSMAAYAMRITDLDPLRHGLIFERFLNPDRVSMPDFDVDFDDRRRGEVIKYVTDKYGEERVAQIVTYGTIKAKQALKDSSRVLGFPFGMGEKLTKAMPPPVMGKDIPLTGIFDKQHPRYKEALDIRAVVESDPEAKTVFDTALGLENLKRQWGVHAAGVIMSSDPLIDVIPIMKREQDGQIVTQFDYPACESLGLIKMDFLGLRNLTIINDALDNIEANRGEKLVLENLELDDRAAYELLSRGDTLGVFQLDGGPMRSLLRLMKPDNFEDISALIALYRPGPMGANSHTNYALRKNGQQEITPIHPELAQPLQDILSTSYGLIIYQEQVMAIAQKVAGFSLGQADILRRAMGKKKKSELDKQFEGFSQGMVENGYSVAAVNKLWEILLPFSDYAFNKAHSAAYGVISYWTAYLKAHYPAEYMAALLTSVGDSKDKMALYLNECRRMGIEVLPPDVNESSLYFAAVGEDIRFGMGAVRNVGANVVEGVREARESSGRFESFHDFLSRVPVHAANKRTVESLIKAGAFDSLGYTRRALVEVHEDAVESAVKIKRSEANGDVGFDFDSLWGDDEPNRSQHHIPERPEWVKRDKLAFEREMLGLYVSDHPLAGLELHLAKLASTSIADLVASETVQDGETVVIAGLVTSVQHRVAKASGNQYGMIQVEDFGGEMTAMFMGKAYQEFQGMLQGDSIVVVRGRVSLRDDGMNLHAFSLMVPDLGQADDVGTVTITMPDQRATTDTVTELASVLTRHPGESEVQLRLVKGSVARVFEVPKPVKVSPDLYGELKALLGPNCLV
ncbi:DNA polymerase III subunit alpha [Leifsonia xyli subsp. xyli]|uniref:DNA polymerase III subunit alpha n=2 Tax=Leifsonia xyli subsp. xyli TaxID=59736 RepID=Q6AE74_LEIXX|nr:DNA polymerase III subunit alpha [Leifsonia xyli]AAT89322.1 DNA polymerase III, alpha subunit [Leifsonia xyli subsp. xyli str. CTCB07]ODA89651.1 DNA polymerase III subunit alpha [Leifsonia xyli subsp. xyli]